VIKELPEMLRGRQLGEIPRLLEDELRRLGMPAAGLEHADSELDAVRKAFAWARAGDLLVLLVHKHRDAAVDLIRTATPGSPLE
jgi:hypothetical protein